MICRQLLGCRRRYCPRPLLLVLVVAICLFYQTLTFIGGGRFLSVLINGIAELQAPEAQERGKSRQNLEKDRHSHGSDALGHSLLALDGLQALQEIEFSQFKNLGNQKKTVVIDGSHSVSEAELQLHQHILMQHGFNVLLSQDSQGSFTARQEKPGGFNTWDLLICLSSSKNSSCIEIEDFQYLKLYQKVNMVPGLQQTLCRKENLCQITERFPDQNVKLGALRSTEEFMSSRLVGKGVFSTLFQRKNHLRRWDPHQSVAPIALQRPGVTEDSSGILKAYVLVTSLTPLRAFIHSTGLAWSEPNQKYFATKLQTFFEKFRGAGPSEQAFEKLKEAITKLLLTAEVVAEASTIGPKAQSRCVLCFQLLTFDVGFCASLQPVIHKVHEKFDFQSVDELDFGDQITKEFLIDDTYRFLLSNVSAAASLRDILKNVDKSIGMKDRNCQQQHDHCLSLEDLSRTLSFIRELKNLGPFQLLYPTAPLKYQALLLDLYDKLDQTGKADTVRGLHLFLSELLEQFQLLNKQTGIEKASWNIITEKGDTAKTPLNVPEKYKREQDPGKSKGTACSHDKQTMSHIAQIFTSPHLELNPEFSPKIRQYYSEVPFDVVTVKIEVEAANCHCQVHLDEIKGPRFANYPLGLGDNRIRIFVINDSQGEAIVVGTYLINIYRETRPSLPLFDDYVICGIVQDCDLLIQPKESCGLKPLPSSHLSAISQMQFKTCEAGDAKGQWIVPCLSCSDNRTCDWREVTWQPLNCQHPMLAKPELQQCMEGRKVLFVGDSTNRGMMYYLMERVNETLQEWDKTHDMKFYYNVNEGRTFISYSYYPQFWIPTEQRPTFEKALVQLVQRSRPLENTDQTVLVVGGVQWLNTNHLRILQKVLLRENLSNILVAIKSLGMGFHLPVDGIRSLSLSEVQNLWGENRKILDTAKQYGYEVVDTFSITMGRSKEFLQGKCACHFHEVVKSKAHSHRKMKFSRHYHLGSYYFNNHSKELELQDLFSVFKLSYHVKGPINQVYSEILLSRICINKKKNYIST
nr:PREDICTED: cadherin-like and PC-esterase domain-containing protein 1 isoform X2 [Latimeria chalumnae]|eukprot:XP_014345491.1 PREDICTED: cadherin-like and PC-esterase domain-containing protein 1 isoform X2 [Latimeria chalumnae]